MKNRRLNLLALAAVLTLVGCQAGVDMGDTTMPGSASPYKPPFKLEGGGAGMKIAEPGTDTKPLKMVEAMTIAKYGSTRSDPFSLTKEEANFDVSQNTERVFNTLGQFTTQFTPAVEPEEAMRNVVVEQQPYRRLSGIIVGDSVLAIMEGPEAPPITPDGGGGLILRPGMSIPNSPWHVQSIDMNKAILVRNGNVEPKLISVRLEDPPPGSTTPTSGRTGNGGYPGGPPGGYPGGFPGGPPGGFPGGPPGGFPGGGGPGAGGGGGRD